MWRVYQTPELNRHIFRYLERGSIIRTITGTPGRERGNVSRYTSTIYNVLSHHLISLLLRKGFVDPIWLIPMLFRDLPKMHGPRSEIRHTTVGITERHGVKQSGQHRQWGSSKNS